jgi:hypothetical protein
MTSQSVKVVCNTLRLGHINVKKNSCRVQLKCDGIRWRTRGEVKGWRMEWVASSLHSTSEHGVSSITTADVHTSAASSRLTWRPPPIQTDSSVLQEDEIWFLRVCHHISNAVHQRFSSSKSNLEVKLSLQSNVFWYFFFSYYNKPV